MHPAQILGGKHMYKKFAVYALCLVISISFVGCQAGSNKHIDENDKIKQDEQIEQEVNTDIGNSGGQFTIDHEGKDTDEASDNNEDVEPIQQQYDNNPVPIDIERIQDMFMGLDTPTEYDYLGWEASGLNPADWRKFTLRAEIYDESIDLQKKTDMAWLERGAIYEDPGYEKTWDMLEAFEGVKDIYLGYNGKSYAAVITLEHTEDEKDFQKEMDMTLLVMKYPFDKIVFLVEDNGKIINQACIDRKRFNTLMFMNEDMENAVFDFPPSEWPLMAKGFDTN